METGHANRSSLSDKHDLLAGFVSGDNGTMNPSPTPDLTGKTDKDMRETGQSPHSAIALWLQRHYTRIIACFGGLLLTLAVVAPIVSPADQRGEIIIMTILFGLIGALMLYIAVAPERTAPGATSMPQREPSGLIAAARISGHVAAKAALRERHARRARARALAGAAFGLLFALAGVIAPFALAEGAASADARFLMVIGFSPVVISGALMLYVFGRTLGKRPEGRGASSHAAPEAHVNAEPATRRAPVKRVPVNIVYRIVIPAAIGLVVLLIAVVIVVVILATLTPLLH